MKCDFILTGASGQLGRSLLRSLASLGRVAVTMRRPTLATAEAELRGILSDAAYEESKPLILLGDIATVELPNAEHIIHSAALTTFGEALKTYWVPNVVATARLADHAVACGARFHFISSIAVARSRKTPLYESSVAIPCPNQGYYAFSKASAELLVSRIVRPEHLAIYRVADLVPAPSRVKTDLRRNHWLTILLGASRLPLLEFPDDYPFYLAVDAEVAAAVRGLMEAEHFGVFHLVGRKYMCGILAAASSSAKPRARSGLTAYIRRTILQTPALASLLDDARSKSALAGLGIGWSYLDAEYWRTFAAIAAELTSRRVGEANESPGDSTTVGSR